MKRRKLMILLTVSMTAFVLAGCGGGSSQTEETVEETVTEVTGEEESQTSHEENDPPEEISDVDFSRTAGLWLLDGEDGTARIYMDGEGYFICYYASGAAEASGYLEYVDEYEDGNGRYDMYDESGEFLNGFYFDSDTQFHMGNGESPIYIREDAAGEAGTEYEEDEMAVECGVLMNSPGFTGLTPMEANNDFHGGYLYSDLTEDGLTVIVNTAFANDFSGDEVIEEYIARWINVISCQVEIVEEEAREIDIEEGLFGTYPCYYLEWLTGWNEDTRHWDAIMICTDAYTYMYAFDTAADFAEEMADVWYETFDNLELYFPGEETE